MLAIVGGAPMVMTPGELIDSFHRLPPRGRDRRTQFELRKAEARYHILEG
jgi:DNA gyrase/topoisomerase IV subunit A